MCISFWELNQFRLLSQLDNRLFYPYMMALGHLKLHRRASSQPDLLDSQTNYLMAQMQTVTSTTERSTPSVASNVPLSSFRRVKSLPIIKNMSFNNNDNQLTSLICSRHTGLVAVASSSFQNSVLLTERATQRTKALAENNHYSDLASSYSDEIDPQPSSSAGKRSCQPSLPSYAISSETSTTSNSVISMSPITFYKTSPEIELINCDNIKIWTDKSLSFDNINIDENYHERDEFCSISWKLQAARNQPKSTNHLVHLFDMLPIQTSWTLNYKTDLNSEYSDTTNCAGVVLHSQVQRTNANKVLDSFLPIYGKKLLKNNSQDIFEDGVITIDYTSPLESNINNTNNSDILKGGSFPTTIENIVSSHVASHRLIPTTNQSLMTFLQMSQLSRNKTDLEKENAHFRVSEAIISAIEQIKWADQAHLQNTSTFPSVISNQSDEAIVKRRSLETTFDGVLTENGAYAKIKYNCLGLLSAEAVGLTLISKFNDEHLPRVSQLKWLVSDEDTPQKLLPMPMHSSTTNADDGIIPFQRGTKHWAPPRQQIIFTDHPPPNRKILLQKQNFRCAGCGMRVDKQYINRFRYCTYLGKYHCTGCHRNQISTIPGKILQAWDFKCYPVSVFAYRLLEQVYTYPLFYVPDLNSVLYLKYNVLSTARHKRIQLKYVRNYIINCRFASREQKYFGIIPDHITREPDLWSMSDLIDVHNRTIKNSINELVHLCENHIFNCVLCIGRGFICEFCHNSQVIYPWENKIFRCDRCGSCFHLRCWKSIFKICCRCQRISQRQNKN